MKALKMLVLIVAITFSSAVSANTEPIEETKPNTVSKSVGELLKNPEFQLNEDVNAIVNIFINEEDEIVVLSVDTDNEVVEKYIKNRLNYQKLSKEAIGYNKSYKVPVKMVKSS